MNYECLVVCQNSNFICVLAIVTHLQYSKVKSSAVNKVNSFTLYSKIMVCSDSNFSFNIFYNRALVF